MPKRKNPDTSLAAYESVKGGMLSDHQAKIIKALEVLGSATAEQIATHLTWEHVQATRRMSELEKIGIVYKPGTTAPTKKGRAAFLWTLKVRGQIVEKKTEKTLPGKTVSDYSKDIKKFEQQELF